MAASIAVYILRGNWPIPSASPACLKLLTWLRMAGIEHTTTVVAGRPRSKTGKAPYVQRPDGSILDDSSVIVEALTREHRVTLDSNRSARERAIMLMIQRTVESHLYFGGLLHRWRDNWPATREAYFAGALPRPLLWIVAPIIRRKTLAQANAQGLGRRPDSEVTAELLADVEALAEILGENDYYFGSPGITDAVVYGTLENARSCPLNGPVKEMVLSNRRWVSYLDRISNRYWGHHQD